MNAREQAYYNRYMKATHRSIFDVYKRPSTAKIEAYGNVFKNAPINADSFAVLSYNTNFFTMACLAIINNIPAMVVITPYRKFGIRLTVDEYRAAREYNNKHVI